MNPLTLIARIPSDADTDADLVHHALTGHDAAFALIMRRYNRLLFRTVRSILKNDDDTQDAVQEAYLRAWRALSTFRADAKLSTWLVRIAVNEALGRTRRGGQVVSLPTVAEAEGDAPEDRVHANPDEQPEHFAMRTEVRRQIEARIDTLPEQFRTVFMLRGVEEMGVEEVSSVLDIPEATVRSRFFRARSMLREGLSRDIDMAVADAFSFAGTRCDKIVADVLAAIACEHASPRT